MALPTPQPYIPRPPVIWALQITQEGVDAAADVGSNEQYQNALTAAKLTFTGAGIDEDGKIRLGFILESSAIANLVCDFDDYLTWTESGTLRIVPRAEFEAGYVPTVVDVPVVP